MVLLTTFQTEMAEQFNQHGYDFYALDLRKYGRSHLRAIKNITTSVISTNTMLRLPKP